MRLIIILFFLCTPFLSANQYFVEANHSHQNEDYDKAIELYHQSLQSSKSLEQYYNLANTYYQQQDYGKAILNYHKALLFHPNNSDIVSNINLSREALNLQPIQSTSLIKIFIQLLSIDTWTWMFVITFWLFIAVLALGSIYQLNSLLKTTIIWTCIPIALICIIALVYFNSQKNLGIVITKDAHLKVSPIMGSPILTELPEASIAKLLDAHDDFFYISTLDNKEGWIQKHMFEKIFHN